MMYRITLVIFIAIASILFASCEKDENVPADNLEQLGIIGKWRLQSRTIQGITDMMVHYDTLEFSTGADRNDWIGEFHWIGAGPDTHGQFELDTIDRSILFRYNNTQNLWEYYISNNYLTLFYHEESEEYIEDWRKVE